MRVAVLCGGRSSEHDVSRASGASVAAGLRSAGHEVVEVTCSRDGAWLVDGSPVALTAGGGLLGVDVAFPVLHGPFGEDGTVQGLLELLDVAYVGSGVLASAVCLEKVVAKDLLAGSGIPQVDYEGIRPGRWAASRDEVLVELGLLGLPVFVKPAQQGSSVGISRVDDESALGDAIDAAFAYDPHVIVEAASTGAEIECSVLGPTDAPEVSVPGQIAFGADWYDFAAKYDAGGMELIVPAPIAEDVASEVRRLAAEAFTRLGCFGLARVDFFVESDQILLNEINTMPGFTPTSVYAKLWEASGLEYPALVERLCALAIDRRAAQAAYRF